MGSEPDQKQLQGAVGTTQKLLGEHIRRPVLAEKYLMKPPFRFLHEIFTSVIETTGFMKTTFTSDELKYEKVSANIDDKRTFLKKAIEALESETGKKCEARPSKILSGKEADKTNEMLQLLAKAITNFSAKSAATASKSTKKPSSTIEDDKKKAPTIKGKEEMKRARSRPAPAHNKSQSQSKTTKEVTKPAGDKGKQVKGVATEKTVKTSGNEVSKDSKQKSSSQKPTTDHRSAGKSGISSKEGTESKALLPSKTSATSLSLAKSTSKHSSEKMSSSAESKRDSKESVPTQPALVSFTIEKGENLELDASKQANEKCGEEPKIAKPIERTSSRSYAAVVAGKTGMLPKNTEEIPLQRPVTRTKYRVNDNDTELEISINEDVLPDNDVSQEISGIGITQDEVNNPNADKSQSKESNMLLKNTEQQNSLQQDVNDSGGTSSDEGITEHMNQKISEWRATSAGRLKTSASAEELSFKTGWIPQPTQEQGDGRSEITKSSKRRMDKVFESTDKFKGSGQEAESNGERIDNNVATPMAQSSSAENFTRGKPTSQYKTAILPQPQIGRRPITVIMDNAEDDDDDETFLVQEKVESETDLTLDRLQNVLMNTAADITHIPPEHRGVLVNQILETQRELEQLATEKSLFKDLQNELAERDKEALREIYMKQVEDLKGAIQKMAKCANPLANIIQRSQDDACLMEIEFRRLRQENERLQRSIDEAKHETARTLYPMTEELAHLDSRIEKMEAAIVMAKQRLYIMDEEYYSDYIYPIGQLPSQDESQQAEGSSGRPIWDFAATTSDDDEATGLSQKSSQVKSMMSVFKRAVSMEEYQAQSESFAPGPVISNQKFFHQQPPPPLPIWPRYNLEEKCQSHQQVVSVPPQIVNNISECNLRQQQQRQVVVQHSRSKIRRGRQKSITNFYDQGMPQSAYGEQKELPVAKDIKPPWWD